MEARILKYIDKLPSAISGRGGHNQTFRVACVLMQGFALSVSDAMPYMEHYNQCCEPQWSRKELLHKLTDAAKRSDRRGYGYLNNPKDRRFQSSRSRSSRRPVEIRYANVTSPKWSGRNTT